MAFELSNKSLALLLIAALVVSLGGTLVSLNRLKSLEAASPATGMVTLYSATAGVNVTITSTTAINFTTNYINFGTGNVNGTCGYCNMYSNYTLDSTGSISSCCQGFSGATTGLVIENIGNTNVSIGMNSTNNAVTFIGGTTSPGPQFRMKVTEKEARACWNGTAGGANDGGGLMRQWMSSG
ncbi:MAG: hypothetical protein NT001_01830 [Candidatus Woesearchaeota archaeon]|nr:hypothetical protein [Candidatus Woesearchaeota archaeon]